MELKRLVKKVAAVTWALKGKTSRS